MSVFPWPCVHRGPPAVGRRLGDTRLWLPDEPTLAAAIEPDQLPLAAAAGAVREGTAGRRVSAG